MKTITSIILCPRYCYSWNVNNVSGIALAFLSPVLTFTTVRPSMHQGSAHDCSPICCPDNPRRNLRGNGWGCRREHGRGLAGVGCVTHHMWELMVTETNRYHDQQVPAEANKHEEVGSCYLGWNGGIYWHPDCEHGTLLTGQSVNPTLIDVALRAAKRLLQQSTMVIGVNRVYWSEAMRCLTKRCVTKWSKAGDWGERHRM